MMRIARMVKMRHMRVVNGKWEVQVVIPPPLRSIIGQGTLTYNTGKRAGKEDWAASIIAAPKIKEFLERREAAWKQIGPNPPGRFVMVSRTLTTLRRPGTPLDINGPARLITGRHGEELVVQGLPVAAQPAPAKLTFPFSEGIELWKLYRAGKRKPPSTKAVKNKIGKMRRLADWLGHSDMEPVTPDDLNHYVEQTLLGKVAAGTVRDHVIDIQAMFALAHKKRRISADPAIGLEYERDTGEEREVFTPEERTKILKLAYHSDAVDEAVRFAHLISGFHGARIAEIVEADTRDIEIVDRVVVDGAIHENVPVFFVRTLHRTGEEKTVKTKPSKRWFVIHSAMRARFIAYVEGVRARHAAAGARDGGGPLFPDLKAYNGRRAQDASNKANNWLRKIGITGKTHHHWRHTVKTLLEEKYVPDRLSDFITGHGGPKVVAIRYLHRNIPEVLAAVELIPNPLVQGETDARAVVEVSRGRRMIRFSAGRAWPGQGVAGL
jgi:integrase